MSFVTDQIRRIDAHLDRHQPRTAPRPSSRGSVRSLSQVDSANARQSLPVSSRRAELLEALIKTVTSASSNQTILPVAQLQHLLSQASAPSVQPQHSSTSEYASREENDGYTRDLEWLLASKLAAQVQGSVLQRLLKEITPVMDDIYYWNVVLGSYNWSALYMVQLLPLQLWRQGREALSDARDNLKALRENGLMPSANGVAQEWQQFYGLVRNAVQERRLSDVQNRLFSPVVSARIEARRRLVGLNKQKQMCASAIGILSNESLNPKRLSSASTRGHLTQNSSDEWKTHVAHSVRLLSETVKQVSDVNSGPETYESTVLGSATNAVADVGDHIQIYTELAHILREILPRQELAYHEQRAEYGRPSRLTRYWLPATALLLSSTTILRILVNRKAEILTWIQDFGKTTVAFWQNWVVDPVKDVVGTIRHDKGSEIAIMSRESLQSDRASLERMVVDFAVDNPKTAGGPPLDEEMVELIRNKVKEGDLTPVLKAYEYDLKKPFARAVTGNLIRELLIQIQKTKVDVEVAMSGIDSLLKSQELVFGFVGLTPGILVCIMLGRWLSGTFGGRKGRNQGKVQSRLIRGLRNIDRILSNSEPQDHGLLTYKDHGLVLCEVQVLQANSGRVLPGDINKEFLEDLKDLTDIHLGVERHIKVVDRLRWAYWKWLN